MGGDNKPLIGHIDNSGDSTRHQAGGDRQVDPLHRQGLDLAYGKPESYKPAERQLQAGISFDQNSNTLSVGANFEQSYQGRIVTATGVAHDFRIAKDPYGRLVQVPDERQISLSLPADAIEKQLRAHHDKPFHYKAYMKQPDGTVVPYEADIRRAANGNYELSHGRVYDAKHSKAGHPVWVNFEI